MEYILKNAGQVLLHCEKLYKSDLNDIISSKMINIDELIKKTFQVYVFLSKIDFTRHHAY